jgi:hypothetical protein
MKNRTLLLGGFALVTACSGNGGGTVEVGTTSSNLTAPPSAVATNLSPHLLVTVTSVSVHVAGADEDNKGDDKVAGPPGSPPAPEPEKDDDGSGWVTIFSGSKTLDLRDSAQVETFLASAPVLAGKITQIRLILAGDATLVDGATQVAVKCPSCTESGLKIVTRGQVTIPSGGTLHLTLDFDQGASLAANGGTYVLNPTIKVTKEDLK